MKKLVVFAALCTAMVACGSGNTNKGTEEKPAESASTPAPAASSDDKGLDMIASLDCTTCHKINEKNIGPAYIDVSKKYEATDANIDMLAQKVIKGGSGNWGTVPMTPHLAVSVDSAREMVRYILNLKNVK